MSWVRIWVHMVFATKNRQPLLENKEARDKVFDHIRFNAKEKKIWLESINGHKEHAHCLVSLGKNQAISKVAQLIKGESSIWINKNRFIENHFNWQDDYWAVSVSESHVDSLKNYIANQEVHHKSKTFDEEVHDFMKKYGWQIIKGN